MADQHQLAKLARSELTLEGPGDVKDSLLWDHAARVLTSAELIAQLPDVAGRDVDQDVLQIAALFHDAGWAVQVHVGQVDRESVLSRPTSDVQFELAAELVESKLKDHYPVRTVQRAADVIRMLNTRDGDAVEAHIVWDADNLDQIGPLGLFQSLRRDLNAGRSVKQILQAWHRQQEYHYWEARIRDGIRFESVRKLAWQRLEVLDPFMRALGEHLEAKDLSELVSEDRAPTKTTS